MPHGAFLVVVHVQNLARPRWDNGLAHSFLIQEGLRWRESGRFILQNVGFFFLRLLVVLVDLDHHHFVLGETLVSVDIVCLGVVEHSRLRDRLTLLLVRRLHLHQIGQ